MFGKNRNKPRGGVLVHDRHSQHFHHEPIGKHGISISKQGDLASFPTDCDEEDTTLDHGLKARASIIAVNDTVGDAAKLLELLKDAVGMGSHHHHHHQHHHAKHQHHTKNGSGGAGGTPFSGLKLTVIHPRLDTYLRGKQRKRKILARADTMMMKTMKRVDTMLFGGDAEYSPFF